MVTSARSIHHRPIYLAGATGTGKSAVAVELARLIGGEIVNADAFQVYRGLNIVAAIPTSGERGDIPHHLYGFIDPSEDFDVARHTACAEPLIADICARRSFAIVVGGSGLYLKSLTHGLAPTPKGDAELRESLEQLSLDDLVGWLEKVDPQGAAATNLKNRRYVTRNLEIALLSGQPASKIKQAWQRSEPDILGYHLIRDREILSNRIHQRTLAMFEAGLVEEIRSLGELSRTAERAIGIREVRALLDGDLSETETVEAICQSTRRYAKRQRTWFRREDALQSVCLAADADAKSVAQGIAEQILVRCS